MFLRRLEELLIIHIPDRFGVRAFCPGRDIGHELTETPLRIDLAQLRQRHSDPIGSGRRHNLSFTRGKCSSDQEGRSSITSTCIEAPARSLATRAARVTPSLIIN